MSPKMLNIASVYQVACVAVLSLGCLFLWPEGALGVLCGGVVMAGNFWFLRTMLARLMQAGERKGKAAYAIALGFKFVVVAGLLGLMIVVLEIHPLGIALGMMSLFLGVGLGVVHATFSQNEAI